MASASMKPNEYCHVIFIQFSKQSNDEAEGGPDLDTIHKEDPQKARLSGIKGMYLQHQSLVHKLVAAMLLAVAVTAILIYLWDQSQTKRVSLIVNGSEREVETKAKRVEDLLEAQNIALMQHDKLSKPLAETLNDGDVISVQHSRQIVVKADGQAKTYHTTAATVGDTIKQLGIQLGEEDKIYPAPQTNIADNITIRIVRVETAIEEYTEQIPFETVTKQDGSILKGKEVTVQAGEEGLLMRRIEKVLEDGLVVSETVVDESVQKPSINHIVAVGTKNPVVALSASSPNIEQVTKNGITFGVKEVLKNVTVTAYDAGPASTGKTKDDPHYGITSSGTKVQEGRTIAVDPKVIPMGWWVYIEGLGFRRAEDTGGAIKGNKIDVYFDSEQHATRFGTKKGYTVYVIGPKKPEEN